MTTASANPAAEPSTGAEQGSETPPHRYTAEVAGRIETRWQDRWQAEGTFHAPNPTGPLAASNAELLKRPKMFVMDMFPYPSGTGLHVGHPLGFIATDVRTRFARMDGYNVLYTMGFDAFGLPAEQYAVQTGQHPRKTTENNMAVYRRQLRQLGLGHDDRRSVATIEPEFYRWTQWIFREIFNSWFDPELDRARPIDELIAAYADGGRPTPDGRDWASMSEVERRILVDDHRLAYRSDAPVNWCPGLGTVLANEEVTAEGRSERGNFPVYKRKLTQWMMRITAYADRLAADLDRMDWPEPIKIMQRNWIGKSIGAEVAFETDAGQLPVFTTRPDTLFGATYMVLSPEHAMVTGDGGLVPASWPAGTPTAWTGGAASPAEAVTAYQATAAAKTEADRTAEGREKTGVFTGSYAVNPVNGGRVPIFIADYVLMGYGTGAIMAVPGQDQRDWDFAKVFELPIVRTVEPRPNADGTPYDGEAYVGEGPAINSANDDISLNGLDVVEAKAKIIAWLEARGAGKGTVRYRLRDWLFSRQRYWGEPFPIVYDEHDLPIVLPAESLPVELPEVDNYSPRTFEANDPESAPEPPLGRADDWVTVELDLGDGPKTYRRELNTMPNWAGSCWYELRYLDPTNKDKLVDPEIERYWMGPRSDGDVGGVDLYIGGKEHAVLHLLYARFWHKVLYDLGYVSSQEPFGKLINQGYVQAYAYTDSRGTYVPAAEVTEKDGSYEWRGQPVRREYGKMGKSLKNVVTPDEMCATYGADTFRLYEMSTGPLEASRPWETRAVVGPYRFLQRVWRLVVDETSGEVVVGDGAIDDETLRLLHKTIDGVRQDYASLKFNTAVAKLTELCNRLTVVASKGSAPREAVEALVLMMAPMTPHVAEELWEKLGHAESLTYEPFPVADESLLVAETVTYPVQVNGKVRGRVTVPADAGQDEVLAAALAVDGVASFVDGRELKKSIVVPGRIVTLVVG